MQFNHRTSVPPPHRRIQNLREFFLGRQSFENEFRKQLRMLITFTLGFTIAFSWRQTTFDTAQKIVQRLTDIQSTTALSIVTSIFITLFSLLVIFIAARLLHDKFEH